MCKINSIPEGNAALMMPLFGKKDSTKKSKKDGESGSGGGSGASGPRLEDKYDMKDVLGT